MRHKSLDTGSDSDLDIYDDKIDPPEVRKIFSYSPRPTTTSQIIGDIDEKSGQRLQQIIGHQPIEELDIFKEASEQVPTASNERANQKRLKKLKAENKQLKEELKKIKLYAHSDKVLVQLKNEYNECVSDCKSVMD